MNFIAAFLWDGRDKSISYMIVDDSLQVISKPKHCQLDSSELQKFYQSTTNIIDEFYEQLNLLRLKHADSKIKIEYKIIGHLSALVRFFSEVNQPSDETAFVKQQFMNKLLLISHADHVQLAKQYRKKLKGQALKEFKRTLLKLRIVQGKRNKAYQFHLWAIAMHATESNYENKLQQLERAYRK